MPLVRTPTAADPVGPSTAQTVPAATAAAFVPTATTAVAGESMSVDAVHPASRDSSPQTATAPQPATAPVPGSAPLPATAIVAVAAPVEQGGAAPIAEKEVATQKLTSALVANVGSSASKKKVKGKPCL